jgi:hypothetical protein
MDSPVFSLLKVVPTANLTLPLSSSVVEVTVDGASEVFVTVVSFPSKIVSASEIMQTTCTVKNRSTYFKAKSLDYISQFCQTLEYIGLC